MVFIRAKCGFLSPNCVSVDLKDLRLYVTRFLEIRSLLFSETLQLVRACKRDKNVPSAFLKKNPVSPHFGQKLSKIGLFGPKCSKMEVFRIFIAIRSLEFANFLD